MEMKCITKIINTKIIEEYISELPEKIMALGVRVLLAGLFLFIGIQVIKIIRKILVKALTKSKADLGVVQFLDSLTKAILYILLVFMIASSFGLDATSVIAVIGSAGVAIGLALQGSLSNFAGGVLILLLKPFKVGDYIIEDNQKNEGTVSEIELFYTKLTTPDNKIIILPNGNLANTSLTNVTTSESRRLDILIGVSYDTNIQEARTVLLSLLNNTEKVMKEEETLIYVNELADSAVILGVRCWVFTQDYLATRSHLLENIKLVLEENKISIPYPHMNILLDTNTTVK